MSLSVVAAGTAPVTRTAGADELPRVLPAGQRPDDSRLGPLRDLDGYFPFQPSASPEAWQRRAAAVRRRVLVATGLWPLPDRPPVEATVHGRVERDEYTVERVYFESVPGLYVTGSLYRPKGSAGKRPAVLSPHGHWQNGRFFDHGLQNVRKQIAAGAERDEVSGRYPLQARCVQLARMGCVVFHYDMLGYADSVPLTQALAHGFRQQRPGLSSPERWGLFSAQSELRLINALGLQTWNSLRALDWVSALDDVDAHRIGVTGASGGGTQTFILAAVDDRPAAVFPAVMVSTAMQGGCTCENASYLRVGTGNIELAALCAPRPLGLTAANDWTSELETKGLPELRQHYAMLGVPERVEGRYFNFEHNYNQVSRAMMYEFFNRHLGLGLESPIVERDFEPLTVAEMTVWDDRHPQPAADTAAELRVLRAVDRGNRQLLERCHPRDEASLAEFRRIVGGAIDVMVGREMPGAGAVEYDPRDELPQENHRRYTGLLRLGSQSEVLPTVFLLPHTWNQEVVVWVSTRGKQSLFSDRGEVAPATARLLRAGFALAAADLLYQGEFLEGGEPLTQTRRVDNPREFAGYTLGYNHSLFAQRVHDVMTVLSYAKHHPARPRAVHLAGLQGAGPWVAAAAIQAGAAVDRVAVGTGGFRFAAITDIRDPQLWPGAVKYGDLPALLALCAPHRLWLAGEADLPPLVRDAYQAAGAQDRVSRFAGPADAEPAAFAAWLTG